MITGDSTCSVSTLMGQQYPNTLICSTRAGQDSVLSSSDTSPAHGYMQTESKKHCYTSTASTPKKMVRQEAQVGMRVETQIKNHKSLPMPSEFKENCGPKCVMGPYWQFFFKNLKFDF